MSGIHPIRPESHPGEAPLARELVHKPWGEGLAYLAAFCVCASVAVILLTPLLLDMSGSAQNAIHLFAAACAALAPFACVAAVILLRRALTPSKILAWLMLPPAVFLAFAGAMSAVRVRDAVSAQTFADPHGRFTITRPDADWRFLPLPILGEGSEVEAAHVRGVPLHVSIRTAEVKDNAHAVIYEIFRLTQLPSMSEHHHGEEPAEEHAAYSISSVEIVVGDETVEALNGMFDAAIAKTAAALEREENILKSLKESHGSAQDIARLEREKAHYEGLLNLMKARRGAGDLSDMLKYLAAEEMEQEAPFAVTVLSRKTPPALDGVSAVRMTVRGTTARGDEFYEMLQVCVRKGEVFVVEGFAQKRDQADAAKAFEAFLAGFRFQ